jgi:hypothetical protein
MSNQQLTARTARKNLPCSRTSDCQTVRSLPSGRLREGRARSPAARRWRWQQNTLDLPRLWAIHVQPEISHIAMGTPPIAIRTLARFEAFGSSNVGAGKFLRERMRGKSHLGWINAGEMIAQGLCSVLASDYYYPAPMLAAFRLAADGVLPLASAWQLVSAVPARAVGLEHRGRIEGGWRADLILVDTAVERRPRTEHDVVYFNGCSPSSCRRIDVS